VNKIQSINILLLLIMTVVTTSCKENFAKSTDSTKNEETTTNEKDNNMEELAIIETKHGKIVIKLFPDLAPKHVESFKNLIKDGFYNGTTFHRVIPNFMIQGGDPLSKDAKKRQMHGTGGPGYSVPAEFSEKNHTRGIVSAARSQDPDSAGSQFFIVVADSPWLDGQYTIFGEVIEGMDVADKIVSEPKDGNDNPHDRIEINATLAENENKDK